MKKSFFCSLLIALALTAHVMPAAPNQGTLLLAIQNDDLVEMIEIIEKDASNITICDEDGRTALYVAALHDDIDLAKYILENHNLSDLDFKKFINQPEMHCGWTPLHIATILEHDEMMIMLIDAGASNTKKDLQGKTPQQCAQEVVCTENEYYDDEKSTSSSSTDLDDLPASSSSTDLDDLPEYLSSDEEDKSPKKRLHTNNQP